MSARTIGLIVGGLILAIGSRILFPNISLHVSVAAEPLFFITEGIPFTNAVLVTIIVDIFLIVMAFMAASKLQLVPRGLQNVVEMIIEALVKLFQGINATYARRAFPVLGTIFLFVIFANLFGLLPGFGSIGLCRSHAEEGEQHGSLAMAGPLSSVSPALAAAGESDYSPYIGCDPGESLVPLFRSPSADLNMTLALSLISVVMIEYFGFSALGPGYLKKFFNFSGPIPFFVGILELVSEIARIPAFMFRLFGNIFAGEVLLVVMIFLVPFGLSIPFYGFEVFVSFIQAFVFAVLTMAFISIAVTSHDDGHH
ncbi:MAG: F0F1 ATP synthase subunit A [Chloroflexaceae bacterium]|nr:F0F1 ATP synthase subunit A [Chloroflexaceae bacterium]